jgi:hypothetical protein
MRAGKPLIALPPAIHRATGGPVVASEAAARGTFLAGPP